MRRNEAAWVAAFLGCLLWSGWEPADRLTWALEVAPALIGLGLLAATRRSFPLTPLAYALVLAHCVVLMIGGKYTYAHVPLFDRIRDAFGLARNHYDRVGHFMQGFVPALLAREILLRRTPLRRGRWLSFLILCACLAISAAYELFEWLAAAALGQGADAFLGSQGDPWDTQKDMACALLGASCCLAFLQPLHDRQLRSGWSHRRLG